MTGGTRKSMFAMALGSVLAGLAGCGVDPALDPDPVDGSVDSFRTGLTMTGEEVALLLRFVNRATTDVDLLDNDVALNRRVAEEILRHRDGPDLWYPSNDDNRIDDLEELDAIRFVGPIAFALLRSYAAVHPRPESELIEGVQFSGRQVVSVLWGVNSVDLDELDYDVGLNRRAAERLIQARPFGLVSEIGAVLYVGPKALIALRAHASIWQKLMEAEPVSLPNGIYKGVTFSSNVAAAALDIVNGATYNELTYAAGIPSGAADAIIANRPHSSLLSLTRIDAIDANTLQALREFARSESWGPALE